nr:immunoglobulin heavy chain junction region [Macaca mulatta]MOW23337.1 immunoglobulin heavy chain junction region [Macaca mulatta]MOW23383.1 immunoglobulin heavy chain junction region [Macaca mulatta]MOW23629.1 immunoglobulin heavy chain junction region [Macaca mulatta]MOW23729.1 immunoglobulin heavy chain junction region [Macaca mulatta]
CARRRGFLLLYFDYW